jgi:GNAT superfamily N-acetyltransferase
MMVQTVDATVREARDEDLPRLVELLEQLSQLSSHGPRPLSGLGEGQRSALSKIRANRDYHLLVVESAGKVQGTCTLYVLPDLDRDGGAWAIVEHVVVDQSQRRRGLGDMLMGEALRLAREAGCYKVSLSSGFARADAHRLYERLGFRNSSKAYSVYL